MVEFAIVLPILLLLLFGIIELSLVLYDKAMITNSSREGARYGIAFNADPATYQYSPYSDAQIRTTVVTYLSNYLISPGGPSAINVAISPGTRVRGEGLTVRVQYDYNFLILPNFVAGLMGLDPLTLAAETVMRME